MIGEMESILTANKNLCDLIKLTELQNLTNTMK